MPPRLTPTDRGALSLASAEDPTFIATLYAEPGSRTKQCKSVWGRADWHLVEAQADCSKDEVPSIKPEAVRHGLIKVHSEFPDNSLFTRHPDITASSADLRGLDSGDLSSKQAIRLLFHRHVLIGCSG